MSAGEDSGSHPVTEVIGWEQEDNGVVVLTMDDPNQSANTMNADFGLSLGAVADRLEAERAAVRGVILTSAKRTFFAGGDLRDLRATTRDNQQRLAGFLRGVKSALRRIETLGLPVVSAINGAALGGGLELCLATHRRIAVDDPSIELGFPEVEFGILPGAGGLTRAVRLFGVARALDELLLDGQRLRPRAALAMGLVDELVGGRDDLLPAARRWIAEQGAHAGQPWDAEGYRVPGGTPATPAFAATLPGRTASLRKRLRGTRYPAPQRILAAAVEGTQVDFETALLIEERYLLDLVTGPVAKNLMQASFFDRQQVRRRNRASDGSPDLLHKVVVLGSGPMAAAIADVSAQSGVDVVLADPTSDPAQADGADVLIETLAEDSTVKAQAIRRIAPRLAPGALLGSNTSMLPIGPLAERAGQPRALVGLHFFAPVERMPLLEIVRGPQTSEATLRRAYALARRLGKLAIVVGDGPGFFTTRVLMAFLCEGIGMLEEGVPAATVEQASAQAGFATGTLRLADELGLDVLRRIRRVLRGDDAVRPADAVIDRMIDELGRPGRPAGKGFYEYVDGRRRRLWPGLAETYRVVADPSQIRLAEMEERMLFIGSLEAIRCLDDGVIHSVADANVGSILGIGFPGWTGGVLQHANSHHNGLSGFVQRSRELAETHGERFAPPASLVRRALRNDPYSDERQLTSGV